MFGLSLPRPYPGELVGSVISRAVIHSGYPPTVLLERIAGRDRSNYSFFLPSMLSRVAELMRMDARRVLWDHTPFPYIVAFMPEEEVLRHEAKTLDLASSIGSLSALIQSVTTGLSALKFCQACVHSDLVEYGESYWHREHCLPAAHMCLKHGSRLLLSSVGANATSRSYGVGLPHHDVGRADEQMLDLKLEHRLATISTGLLTPRTTTVDNWYAVYRNLALERGFVMTSGDVAGAHLSSELLTLYGEPYLVARSCKVADPGRSWPALMVRERTSVPFVPLKHVLLQAFLERADGAPTSFAYRLPGKVPRDARALDAEAANKVRRAAIRANLMNVRTTMTKLLQASGTWSAFRHDRTKFPLTAAELEAFRKTEASERKLGGRDAHRKRMEKRAADKKAQS